MSGVSVVNSNFFSAAGGFFLKNDRNQWFLYRNNIFMTLFYTHMLIKFHQNLEKLSFSMTFIGFYQTLIEISSNNNQKRSKMIRHHRSVTNPQIFYFWSSFTQNWVRCRPDRRDVSARHVMGHLERPPMLVRSDCNDWDRPSSDGVQTTFWDHRSTTHKFSIFDHLSPKTESDTDQIDVVWVQGMSGHT